MIEATDAASWARRLKVRHLECFLVLHDSGTLSEAAVRMHMTQSAMSHWLTDLEAMTGVKLALRGRRVELTPAGQALRRLAIRVLGDVTRTHDELGAIAEGATRSIHVGSVAAGISYVVPQAIVGFQRERPEVVVRITEGVLDALLEGLEKREMDVILGSLDSRAYGSHLEHEVLFEDDMTVISGVKHPLAARSKVNWTDLFDYPWAMPPKGTLMRARLDAALLNRGGAGIRPRVETGSLIAVESLLRQTDYIAVWPASLARHLAALGGVHILGLSDRFGPVGAVWRAGDRQPEVEQFMTFLRRAAQEYAAESAAPATAHRPEAGIAVRPKRRGQHQAGNPPRKPDVRSVADVPPRHAR
jgi:DNA-binding transcriptional LysR family regulator